MRFGYGSGQYILSFRAFGRGNRLVSTRQPVTLHYDRSTYVIDRSGLLKPLFRFRSPPASAGATRSGQRHPGRRGRRKNKTGSPHSATLRVNAGGSHDILKPPDHLMQGQIVPCITCSARRGMGDIGGPLRCCHAHAGSRRSKGRRAGKLNSHSNLTGGTPWGCVWLLSVVYVLPSCSLIPAEVLVQRRPFNMDLDCTLFSR